MGVTGLLQLILVVAIAGAAALCGFVAATVILRGRRRARGYFVLGVLTGLMAGTVRRPVSQAEFARGPFPEAAGSVVTVKARGRSRRRTP